MVRKFDTTINPMPLLNEVPLKLARKCLDVFGTAGFDKESEIHTISKCFLIKLKITKNLSFKNVQKKINLNIICEKAEQNLH